MSMSLCIGGCYHLRMSGHAVPCTESPNYLNTKAFLLYYAAASAMLYPSTTQRRSGLAARMHAADYRRLAVFFRL
ncbi:hypothetical protein PT2222_50012 [Paraburkholderia tropica]